MITTKIIETYRERKNRYTEKLENKRKTGNLLSIARLLIFVVGIVLTFLFAGIHYLISIGIFILFLGLFFWTVKRHAVNLSRQRHLSELVKINDLEIRACEGNINDFESGLEYFSTDHPFSYDLDLFGDGSLFQFLNRSCSKGGKEVLKSWLIDPLKNESEIRARQVAIKELNPWIDWRQNFLATGNTYRETGEEKESILDWANASPVFTNSRFIKIIRFLLPVMTALILILSIVKILPASFPVALILIQLTVIAFNLSAINKAHRQVTQRFEMLKKYAKLLYEIENADFFSTMLKNLKNRLVQNDITAAHQIDQLAGIIHRFDRRLDMILGIVLNGLFLWDLHCVVALDRWKMESHILIPEWFAVVTEMDALISIANYAYNHPNYPFPGISGNSILESKDIGHPLIPEKERVVNDFSINKQGSLVILTGPNMAGKSTFLRTVGINLLLGMIGAPVCATTFLFTPLNIYSSMRTSDSLLKNESYFYAELRRLKVLKEKLTQKENIFILLDEILKGTNSQDKHVGSKLFIKQLIKMMGTGLIATHDVELGKMEQDFPENITNKCFEVEIDGEEIFFDYILRDGITKKMNAAYLMGQMGIV